MCVIIVITLIRGDNILGCQLAVTSNNSDKKCCKGLFIYYVTKVGGRGGEAKV